MFSSGGCVNENTVDGSLGNLIINVVPYLFVLFNHTDFEATHLLKICFQVQNCYTRKEIIFFVDF